MLILLSFHNRAEKIHFNSRSISENSLSVTPSIHPFSNAKELSLPDSSILSGENETLAATISPEPIKELSPVSTTIHDSIFSLLKDTTPPDLSSQPAEGFLKILTNPPWVTIYIDGIERGKTPKTNLVILARGMHTMTLSKEGYQKYTDTLLITPSDTQTLRIRLQQDRLGDH